MSTKIKVAVLGCGGRGNYVVNNLLRDSERKVEIVAVYDPDPAEMELVLNTWKMPDAKRCKSYQEAIDIPCVDWVMVFSPNANHCEQVLAAFAAHKHVFSEKPLATSIEDCQKIFEAHQKSGCKFATGFVLRYSSLYRKAKELLTSGKLGKLLSIDANENITPVHGGYIMCNWRRFTKFAGPHILEKCCHDLDLINWFCDSLPSKVAAFGSLDFFKPENQKFMDKYGKAAFKGWRDPHAVDSPFTSEKDLCDTQVGIVKYRNGVKVQFQATMANAIPERRMYFACTEGTMVLDLYTMTLKYAVIGEEEVHQIKLNGDGHGGGDDVMMKEIFESMVHDAPIKCSGNEGLQSAVFALAYDQAMREEQVVDLEPVWKKLNR